LKKLTGEAKVILEPFVTARFQFEQLSMNIFISIFVPLSSPSPFPWVHYWTTPWSPPSHVCPRGQGTLDPTLPAGQWLHWCHVTSVWDLQESLTLTGDIHITQYCFLCHCGWYSCSNL